MKNHRATPGQPDRQHQLHRGDHQGRTSTREAAEIENLQAQARIIARLPVLIGDHRLNVESSARTDNTLTESRWQVLDARLIFVGLRTFTPITQGGNSAGSGVSEMGLLVAKGLQSRRHMLLRSVEANVFKVVMDRNEGVLDEFPTLEFSPKRISLTSRRTWWPRS
jgi:hypothetical protein